MFILREIANFSMISAIRPWYLMLLFKSKGPIFLKVFLNFSKSVISLSQTRLHKGFQMLGNSRFCFWTKVSNQFFSMKTRNFKPIMRFRHFSRFSIHHSQRIFHHHDTNLPESSHNTKHTLISFVFSDASRDKTQSHYSVLAL